MLVIMIFFSHVPNILPYSSKKQLIFIIGSSKAYLCFMLDLNGQKWELS